MSEPTPSVTIVVPSYESAGTIRATVESVLAQTRRDFVLHIVDDGSTRHPVPEDLPGDPRIIVERLPENVGYAGVTNHAIGACTTEWITFVDADDTIAPTYLEELISAGEAAGADVVFTPMVRHAAGVERTQRSWSPTGPVSDARTAMRGLLRGDLVGTQHLLIRHPRPVAVLGQAYNDFDIVMKHVADARAVAYVDEPLYFNEVHAGSVTGSLRPSIWDLIALPALVAPIVEASFDPREAAELTQAHRDLTLTQVLHAAANEKEDSPLRREVTAWCRRAITLRGILRQAISGDRTAAGSWALAKVSPALHRRAYQAYQAHDRRAA